MLSKGGTVMSLIRPILVMFCLLQLTSCVSGGKGGNNSGDSASIPVADAGASMDGFVTVDSGTVNDMVSPVTDTSMPGSDTSTPPSDASAPLPVSQMVDPGCVDGQYEETLPNPDGDISGLMASYTPDGYIEFIDAALQARFPLGAALVEGGLQNQQIGHCIDFFLSNKSTPEAVVKQFSTIVHECGHFYDIGLSGFEGATYVITESLTLTCSGGDKKEYGGNTFVRSELTNDTFSDEYPPCPEGQFGGDCDFYANTYLAGQSGDQGFSMLFEEFVQYVNSLATGYAFNDFYAGSSSARDGILTFAWYIERYLYLARTKYPDTYAFLANSACWREAILTVWGRAWLYLEATKDIPALGISDDKLKELVQTPALLAEIQALRDLHGCP
jgi:hypothetical protein